MKKSYLQPSIEVMQLEIEDAVLDASTVTDLQLQSGGTLTTIQSGGSPI